MKILIVEDDAVQCEIIRAMLMTEEQFEPLFTHSGLEALKKLKEHNDIAAILLDRNMPSMDGMAVIHELKTHAEWVNIPVIFQTAADNDKDVIDGTEAGAYYYLKKPFEAGLLRTVLHCAISDSIDYKAGRLG